MEELAKIRRTIGKRLPEAQPEVLFVLDATTGQNGLLQAKAFHEATGLTAIALTKLDSTRKGGIAFAIERQLGVPVLFVGVGEKIDDLLDFDPNAFVAALFARGAVATADLEAAAAALRSASPAPRRSVAVPDATRAHQPARWRLDVRPAPCTRLGARPLAFVRLPPDAGRGPSARR